MTVLLILIYISFISLGVPDSLLGAAWPSIHVELGVDISLAGIVSLIIACGTVVSSLFSARWVTRIGTGKVVALGVLATAKALLGFSLSSTFWLLPVFAIPLGLGAGAIDSSLNSFVTLHYQAKQLNWLHSFWGIGCTGGPLLISAFLGAQGSWRTAYWGMAAFQVVLMAALLFAHPLWRRVERKESAQTAQTGQATRLREIIRQPLAKPVFLSMLCYCGAEATLCLWSASYLTNVRQLTPQDAAAWVSAYFAGITVGRITAGFLSSRVNDTRMIRLGQGFAFLGLVLLCLPLPAWVLPIAFFIIGTGFGPIFPAIIHQTPYMYREELSRAMIGVEIAFAYTGNICMPPLFGALSSRIGLGLFPFYALLLFTCSALCTEYVKKRSLIRSANG